MSIKIITDNKKARFDYTILEVFEAGLVLTGSEVKSLRDNQANLKDSYISFRGDEAYLQNAHIAEYAKSSHFNHEPQRVRKLLLHKEELKKIYASIREKGLSCIPLKLYFKKGIAKVEIALVKGKNKGDKRESIKRRDVNLELQQLKRKSR